MRKVHRRHTKRELPWCTCASKSRNEGWTLRGGWWVHPECGKPSRLCWQRLQHQVREDLSAQGQA